jgi:hypothetical protein
MPILNEIRKGKDIDRNHTQSQNYIWISCPKCKEERWTPSVNCKARSIYCSKCARENISRPSVEERFWKYVNKTDYCWIWSGGKYSNGYGSLAINTYPVLAHRFSYELHFGKINPNLLVCHKCDNPSCVNPEHLFLGTQKDNLQDMIFKNRLNRKGEKSNNHILSKDDVISIRKRYNEGGSVTEIFNDYKNLIANRESIRSICKNLSWTNI